MVILLTIKEMSYLLDGIFYDSWAAFLISICDMKFCVVVVVGYPTPSEGWGHGGRPWSPRSQATPQGLDQRS